MHRHWPWLLGALVLALASFEIWSHTQAGRPALKVAEPESEAEQQLRVARNPTVAVREAVLEIDWAPLDRKLEATLFIASCYQTAFEAARDERKNFYGSVQQAYLQRARDLKRRRETKPDEVQALLRGRMRLAQDGEEGSIEPLEGGRFRVRTGRVDGAAWLRIERLLTRPGRISFHACPQDFDDPDAIKRLREVQGANHPGAFETWRLMIVEALPQLNAPATSGDGDELVVNRLPLLEAPETVSAEAKQPSGAFPQLELGFSPATAQTLAVVTRPIVHGRLAVLLDGRALVVPVIEAPLEERCVLSFGGIPFEEVREFANYFNSRPLPAPMKVVSVQVAQ